MKTLEAAIILPLIVICFCLQGACLLLVYLQADIYSRNHVSLAAEVRRRSELVSYGDKELDLPYLGRSNAKAGRRVTVAAVDIKAGKLLDFLIFVEDELNMGKAV